MGAEIAITVAVLILLVTAVGLSLRRNKRAIDSFEYPDLDVLSLCVATHRIAWMRRKLDRLGWEERTSEPIEGNKLNSKLVFKKRDPASSAHLREVLHALNRSLALPIGVFELTRQTVETKN